MQNVDLEQEVISLSKEKWHWMSECNMDALKALFHEKSVFVHLGGSWEKNANSISSKAVGFTIRKRTSMKYRENGRTGDLALVDATRRGGDSEIRSQGTNR